VFIRFVVWWRNAGFWCSVGVGRRISIWFGGCCGVASVDADADSCEVEVDVDVDMSSLP